jgi:hypothetical protein
MPIDSSTGGNFYTIHNVQVNSKKFCDFQILIDGGITYRANIDLLTTKVPQKSSVSNWKKSVGLKYAPMNAKPKVVKIEEIRHLLNGIGRIFEYEKHVDNSCEILAISEGVIKSGAIHGYGRVIDHSGECKVGFWKLDQSVSRPCGKFSHYKKDGSLKQPEGLYMGN